MQAFPLSLPLPNFIVCILTYPTSSYLDKGQTSVLSSVLSFSVHSRFCLFFFFFFCSNVRHKRHKYLRLVLPLLWFVRRFSFSCQPTFITRESLSFFRSLSFFQRRTAVSLRSSEFLLDLQILCHYFSGISWRVSEFPDSPAIIQILGSVVQHMSTPLNLCLFTRIGSVRQKISTLVWEQYLKWIQMFNSKRWSMTIKHLKHLH